MTHLCGPLGQALAVVDNVTWLYEDKQRRLPTANEINFFFSQGLEVRPIDPLRDGELTEESLPSLLELETRRFQALQGLLIGMDAEIEDQLRIRNMRRSNRLLSDHRVSQFVERRFIRPVNGQEWDLDGARRLAHSEELSAVLRLYKIIIGPSLIRLEDEITAWAIQHGYTSIERAAEIRKAYDTGLIALLATSMHDDEPSELLKRVFFAKSADWDRRLATYLVRRLVPKEPFADAVSGRLVEEDSPDLSTTTGADRLRSRISELLEEYNSDRSKWERERYRVDHVQAYEAALKQIEWIARRFKSHHPEAAWGDLTKLAERQFTEGGPQKFAMSLTNLATQLGENASVAFTLYDMAVNCASEDVTIHTARAETLRALGRVEEALAAYDRTVEDFPQNAVARTGRAETLRALDRVEEALAAYDRTVEDFPHDAVARTGRAETLRALGRVEEALAAYDRTVEDFPHDAVARNGRAETLRALGRFDEVLAAYNRTVEDFPHDTFARTGRAETLRALGRVEEALAAYDRTVEDFPQNAVARTGRAETLRALGRVEEALAAYDRTVEEFPHDAVARNGRAETLRALGRFDEALAAYDRTVEDFPQNAVARTGRAETLRALGRIDEALAAYDRAVEDFPHDAFARNGRAETLRALGRIDEALAAYDRAVEDFPQNAFARNGRAVVLADAGRLDEARKALQSAVQEPISAQDWVAVHILSMIELRAGATDALAANLEGYAANCPYREHRRYFKTSLAVLRISLNRIKEARRTIEDLSMQPEFDQDERAALKLIKAHAEAADGDLVAARRSIAAVSNIVPYEEFRLRQLRREIEGRFGLGDRPSLTKPEELATEDQKLMRLEMNFFVDRARASAMSKAA